MSLNPKYVTAPSLQEYFVDKATGLPLVGGKVYYYRDSSRTEYKSVYELQGNSANYTYSALPNPITLSAVGTIQDNSRNDIIPYYYPFDENGDLDLYYIRVFSATGVFQFERQAWPNPNIDNGGVGSDELINYIPNGQFLSHTNLPENKLVAGTNVLAQGGFTFELPDPLPGPTQSITTAEFIVENFTEIPGQSPRYILEIQCTTSNQLDSIKALRIKFKDVNKFSAKPAVYTFAFSANTLGQSIPAVISTYKFFGTDGSPPVKTPKYNFTITPASNSDLYQFKIDFELNTGKNIDTVNNDDFVALDIDLPVGFTFTAQFDDFVLTPGEVDVLNFPVQTDADMLTRGVMGWVNTPEPTGMDLYLPPILTKEGMIFDRSQIGTVGQSIGPILTPDTIPAPQHNMMPFDGSIYITSEYASNGIPYRRLFNYLSNIAPYTDNGLPLYGTGDNYVSALIPFSGSVTDILRITYNVSGTGSTLAADSGGGTGFAFSPLYTYNGSTTGVAPLGIFASSDGILNQVLCFTVDRTNDVLFTSLANGSPSTGFTLSNLSVSQSATGLTAYQGGVCTINTVSGSALQAVGTGRNFQIQITGGPLYTIWFNVDGANTAPAGAYLIQVAINSLYTDLDVANILREVLNGLNSTLITVPAAPDAGEYFTFSSNPGALRNFYVWYSYSDSDNPPTVSGTGIEVRLVQDDEPEAVRDKTRIAINSYQFLIPDFSGLFFRNADLDGVYDLDSQYRFSNVCNIGGAAPGTFEYSQFLGHTHTMSFDGRNANATGGVGPWCLIQGEDLVPASNISGGTETRPVNTYVFPFIRY